MELLTQVTHRVHGTLLPKRIVELFRLGDAPLEGSQITLGVPIKSIVETFFSSPGFPRLLSSEVIKRAIISGVQDRQFAYWGQGEPELGDDRKYKVSRQRVALGTVLQQDEIDIERGFLIHPIGLQEIPSSSVPSSIGLAPTEGAVGTSIGPTEPPTPPEALGESRVSYLLEANRDQLFKAWSALANLADMAGKLVIRVQAKSDKRLDRNKLRNAVEEPLDELGVLKKREE